MNHHDSSLPTPAAGAGHDGSNHQDHHHHHGHTHNNSNDDLPIIATANNALLAKHATIQAGYYVDPFVDHFYHQGRSSSDGGRGRGSATTTRQRPTIIQPLIKRGTHARVCVMDRAIDAFLKEQHGSTTAGAGTTTCATAGAGAAGAGAAACQIVVLGAGFDTTYFRFRNGNLMAALQQQQKKQGGGGGTHDDNDDDKDDAPPLLPPPLHVHWSEVDHAKVVQEKAKLIQSSNLLSTFCPHLTKTKYGFCSSSSSTRSQQQQAQQSPPNDADKPTQPPPQQPPHSTSSSTTTSDYYLVGHDLRASPQLLLETKLQLDPTLPTLFLMECVSMYLPQPSFQQLLHALSQAAHDVTLVCYEAILGLSEDGRDPFGKMMERNLIRAKVALPGSCLLQTRTLQAQLDQMVVVVAAASDDASTVFQRAVGCDMWSAYETVVTPDQRDRANQSEFLDEYEEWVLIMKHYCFVVAQGGRKRASSLSLSSSSSSQLPSSLLRSQSAMGLTRVGNDAPLGFQKGKCMVKEFTTDTVS